jgi:hypothetical protein
VLMGGRTLYAVAIVFESGQIRTTGTLAFDSLWRYVAQVPLGAAERAGLKRLRRSAPERRSDDVVTNQLDLTHRGAAGEDVAV